MNDLSVFYIPQQLESERLRLRVLQPGDGRVLHEAAVESFKELHPWMDWATHMPTLSESENYAREAARMFLNRDEINYLIFRRSDNLVVGAMGVHHIAWDVPRFELGYWGRTRTNGHGYISEAARAVTKFVFETLGAERVEIRCDARNVRSAALASRVGYNLEARLRRDSRANDDSLRDTLIYVLLRDEYEQMAEE